MALKHRKALFQMLPIKSCHRLKTGRTGHSQEVYPVLYIDAIHYSVRDNGVIRKLAAYVILGINREGRKRSPDHRGWRKRKF